MDYFWKFLTVFVAIFGATIAFHQFRLSREKFKLDLFEKRFSVFAGTRRFLTLIASAGRVDLNTIFEYRNAISEASFLFEKSTEDFLEEIYKRAVRMNTIDMKLKDEQNKDKRSHLAEEEATELNWLIDQLPLLKKVFEPYLKFRVWH